MARFFFTLWVLIPALALAVEDDPEALRAQIQRLEAALRQNGEAQKARTETFRALEREKESRFTKKKEEIAEALVTLPIKAFPNPTTARERAGESQVQASLVKYATKQFEQLATVADSDSTETLPALDAKAAAPPLTSFATLKQRLNQVGDQVLSKDGALGAVADKVKARVEAIRAQEKPETEETTASEDHPDAEPIESEKKAKATLNQLMAAEFERSAALADGYFKFAEEKLKPLAEQEAKTESDVARNETPEITGPGTQPPPALGVPPAQPAEPPLAANSQNDSQNKNPSPQNQQKGTAQNSQGGEGGGSPGSDSEASHSALAPVKIATPGSIPDVARLTMESPKESDLSVLAEVTRALTTPVIPSAIGTVAPLQIPALPISGSQKETAPVAVAPRRIASLLGDRTPGSAIASREAESASPVPLTETSNPKGFNGSSGGPASGQAGVFNVDPKYPDQDGRLPKRINVGFVGGGDEDDDSSPTAVGSLVYGGKPPFPLLAVTAPRVQRGILSHVGEWCRTIGRVAACAR